MTNLNQNFVIADFTAFIVKKRGKQREKTFFGKKEEQIFINGIQQPTDAATNDKKLSPPPHRAEPK